MANIFGFSTDTSSSNADIIPLLKYDSRAGRMFRVDRVDTGNGYVNTPVDITKAVKFVADLENVEVGYMNFNTGGAPHFALVPMGNTLPPKPTQDHKPGVRFMVKLSKDCAGTAAVREVSSVAKAFLAGVEALYMDYSAQKDANEGKLPVVTLDDTIPVKSGSGDKTSVNYQPVFKIIGWAPRGDLVFRPKAGAAAPAAAPAPTVQAPPSTGSTRVSAPAMADDLADFG